MTEEDAADAAAYLRRDPFANVTPLKMLATFGEHAVLALSRARSGAVQGLSMLLPTSAYAYDRDTYPDADFAVLMAADSPAVADALLDALPSGRRFVFKLADPSFVALARRRFALERKRCFVSYGAAADAVWRSPAGVSSGSGPNDDLLPLYAAQGYDGPEVRRLLDEQDGRWFAFAEDGRPLAACLTFRNFDPVYELGALFVAPSARRRGLARKVVVAALADLAARGLAPRYQVDESNTASAALAESIGLRRFVVLEHWEEARR